MNKLAIVLVAVAAAGCSQGNSDNVMSPEQNAVTPAQVNEALGPEVTNTTDLNIAGNDMNAVGNELNPAYPFDEPGMNNSAK